MCIYLFILFYLYIYIYIYTRGPTGAWGRPCNCRVGIPPFKVGPKLGLARGSITCGRQHATGKPNVAGQYPNSGTPPLHL